MSKGIVVRRSVYNAAQELQQAAASGGRVLSLAETRIDECMTSGDKAGTRFWRQVWLYLMSETYSEAAIHIIEDRH
jgi:hypothetical protein